MAMIRKMVVGSLLAGLLVAGVGCDDSPGEEVTLASEESPVEAEESAEEEGVVVAELDEEGVIRACEKLDQSFRALLADEELRDGQCRITAAMASLAVEGERRMEICEVAFDECDPQAPDQTPFAGNCFPDPEDRSRCQVSVEAIRECFEAYSATALGALRELAGTGCEELVEMSQEDLIGMINAVPLGQVPECRTVVERCPVVQEM
jgi:hypothetical protein